MVAREAKCFSSGEDGFLWARDSRVLPTCFSLESMKNWLRKSVARSWRWRLGIFFGGFGEK